MVVSEGWSIIKGLKERGSGIMLALGKKMFRASEHLRYCTLIDFVITQRPCSNRNKLNMKKT